MQDFKIGQPVVISHTTTMSYLAPEITGSGRARREQLERCAYAYPLTQTRRGVIVGVKNCPLGVLHVGTGSNFGNYQPNGSIQLWEVKIGMRNKVVLVQDQHAIACDEFELPTMAPRLRVGEHDSETTATDLGWAPRRTRGSGRRATLQGSAVRLDGRDAYTITDVGEGRVAVDFETTGAVAAIPDQWAYAATQYLNSANMAQNAMRILGAQSHGLLST